MFLDYIRLENVKSFFNIATDPIYSKQEIIDKPAEAAKLFHVENVEIQHMLISINP